MIVGMMWHGKNVQEAIDYYQKKYNRLPDEVEINEKAMGVLKSKDGKLPSYDGVRLHKSNLILENCLLVGVGKDKDYSSYL